MNSEYYSGLAIGSMILGAVFFLCLYAYGYHVTQMSQPQPVEESKILRNLLI